MSLNAEPTDLFFAIAFDLLAQTEAQHRTATRLEIAARALSRAIRERASADAAHAQVREQLRLMREIVDAERALLDEFDRELSSAR